MAAREFRPTQPNVLQLYYPYPHRVYGNCYSVKGLLGASGTFLTQGKLERRPD